MEGTNLYPYQEKRYHPMAKSDQRSDEYEILPHSEIMKLKRELDDLKAGHADEFAGLKVSIDNLKKSIDLMNSMFKDASEDIKAEQSQGDSIAKKVDPIIEKIASIGDQNEKIANALLAVADIVNDLKDKIEDMNNRPVEVKKEEPMPPRQ